jgi:hypothetical protein
VCDFVSRAAEAGRVNQIGDGASGFDGDGRELPLANCRREA